VLELYGRLKEDFESGIDVRAEPSHRDAGRQGKKLGSSTRAGNGKAAGPSG
jgi:hypothetical protein